MVATGKAHLNSAFEYDFEMGSVEGIKLCGNKLVFMELGWWRIVLHQETFASRVHIEN